MGVPSVLANSESPMAFGVQQMANGELHTSHKPYAIRDMLSAIRWQEGSSRGEIAVKWCGQSMCHFEESFLQ